MVTIFRYGILRPVFNIWLLDLSGKRASFLHKQQLLDQCFYKDTLRTKLILPRLLSRFTIESIFENALVVELQSSVLGRLDPNNAML